MVTNALFIVLFFAGAATTILAYIVTFIRFIACHKKHECGRHNCPLWAYCDKTAQNDRIKEEIKKLRLDLQERIRSGKL